MLLVLIAASLAAPARCVATWTGPVESCAIRGEVKATAAGPGEWAARRALRRELLSVVDLVVEAQRARLPTQSTAGFAGCRAAVTDAWVNCFEDAWLSEDTLCFAELADPECWNGRVVELEGVAWQAINRGRDALCRAVDDRLLASGWTDLPTRRALCAASCEANATVRCLRD